MPLSWCSNFNRNFKGFLTFNKITSCYSCDFLRSFVLPVLIRVLFHFITLERFLRVFFLEKTKLLELLWALLYICMLIFSASRIPTYSKPAMTQLCLNSQCVVKLPTTFKKRMYIPKYLFYQKYVKITQNFEVLK